ncbi:MAG: hydroxymethylpyrimidine/phosphomethylpyrimidine kinase [Pseudomonadales bacterium]|nr:hydroxymethylpyrimidine/phosphomethylpyrimidine kinase [Pseudomonadales bacterium]
MVTSSVKPNVLCFSGMDSTGGAGIQADIESLFSIGCHCLPVITAITVQDTRNVSRIVPTEPLLLVEQARAVLEDMSVQAFKIGLIGSIENIEVIHTLLTDYPNIPVVLDPILQAGGGFDFSTQNLINAMKNLLLPITTVLTPNTDELQRLATEADSPEACAAALLDSGCGAVLLTGTHAASKNVINQLFTQHQAIMHWEWPRLPEQYHGSGCTLAASLAAYLAHGAALKDAVRQAQQFTWNALAQGQRPGCGQYLPDRSFWQRS